MEIYEEYFLRTRWMEKRHVYHTVHCKHTHIIYVHTVIYIIFIEPIIYTLYVCKYIRNEIQQRLVLKFI